jgi:hypothetical protein
MPLPLEGDFSFNPSRIKRFLFSFHLAFALKAL